MNASMTDKALQDAIDIQKGTLKRFRIEIILISVMIVLFSAYSVVINHKLSDFNSNELATMIREGAHQSMPKLKTELKKQAIAAAPEVIEKAKVKLLESPRILREFTEEQTANALSGVMIELESNMHSIMHESFDTAWSAVEGELPELDDEERLDVLIEEAAKNFRKEMNQLLDLAYEAYGTETQTLVTNLNQLSNPESKLSSSERIYKELIQSWLVLSDRYKPLLEPTDA